MYSLKVLKANSLQPRTLYTARLSLRIGREKELLR